MKQTISQSDFHDAFIRMDRKENFSWEARELLFEYFEEVNEDMELDVIAICCEYYENDLATVISEYRLDDDVADMDDDEKLNYVRDYLSDNTSLIGETSAGFIYAAF
jgi:hypothetical protein